MFNNSFMSPSEIGGQIKVEFVKSSPKIRFSIIAHLLEFGIPQEALARGLTLTDAAQEALDFVTADVDSFHGLIDEVYKDPEPTSAESEEDLPEVGDDFFEDGTYL